MRRLILSFFLEDLTRIQREIVPPNIEAFEVLHVLRHDKNEIAMICRVTLKDPSTRSELFRDSRDRAQLLEQTKEGVLTYFVRTEFAPDSFNHTLLKGIGGYFTRPFELKDGKVTLTFLGSSNSVRKLFQNLDKKGLSYKLISLEDARFSPHSPLSSLTSRQRRVLISAFRMGYYDQPKKISSRELAEKLGMQHPTLSIHRIKAEKKLIEGVLRENGY